MNQILFTVSTVLDVLAMLIPIALYAIGKHGRADRKRGNRFFGALALCVAAFALTDLIGDTLIYSEAQISTDAVGWVFVLSNLCFSGIFMLTALVFLERFREGGAGISRKALILLSLPMIAGGTAEIVVTAANLSLSWNESILEMIVISPLSVTVTVYLIICLVLLFRYRRNAMLTMISVIAIIWIINEYRATLLISVVPFLISLSLLLFEVGRKIRHIGYQLGCALTALFLVAVPTIENLFVTSQMDTMLRNMHRNEEVWMSSMKRDLTENFSGLNWYAQRWIQDPEEVSAYYGDILLDRESDEFREFQMLREVFSSRPDGKTWDPINACIEMDAEALEGLSPEIQGMISRLAYYLFVSACVTYDMEDSDSIMTLTWTDPEGTSWTLYDGAGKKDGNYLLGEKTEISKLEKAVSNYEHVTNPSLLDWNLYRYGEEDYFGYSVLLDRPAEEGLFRIWEIEGNDQLFPEITSGLELLLLGLLLVVSALILLVIRMIAVTPLRKVQKSLTAYRQDKNGARAREALAGIRSNNEISVFAEHFSELTEELERYVAEITQAAEERERTHAELNLAARIQRDAIPVDPLNRPEISLAGSMTPARDIGGDFYDYFLIDEDHLALVIADVSGKGVPAALFMMSVKIMLNNRAMAGGTPGQILTDVNGQVAKNNQAKMFVTVWLGILDLRTGELVCANAGHEYPAIRSGEDSFRIFRDTHGLVLCGMKGLRYRDYSLRLVPGDAVFVYTDGVPEADNPEHAFYGLDRLETVLSSLPAAAEPGEILQSVQDSVQRFSAGAEQFDDRTMLCLVYHGGGSAASGEDAGILQT